VRTPANQELAVAARLALPVHNLEPPHSEAIKWTLVRWVVARAYSRRSCSCRRDDRLLGLRFGAAAARALGDGQINVMVALDPPKVKTIPLTKAIETMKSVPLDCDTMQTARAMDVCLGD
jgi:6-phosphofructokinase